MAYAPQVGPVIEVADFLATGPSPEEIAHFRLSAAAEAQIEHLLDKEDEGTLAPEERRQLDELMILNELVTLIRSRVSPSPAPPAPADDGGAHA